MRDELRVLESNYDYLGGKYRIHQKNNKNNGSVTRIIKGKNRQFQKVKGGISQKSKIFLGKALNNHKDPKTWESEYLEHVLYKICFALIHPFPPKKSELAAELGIKLHQLDRLVNLRKYTEIKNSLRKELRARWGADIDRMVVKQAMRGAGFQQALYYRLQGELMDKLEVTKKSDIPDDPEKRKEMIDKYIQELGYVKLGK